MAKEYELISGIGIGIGIFFFIITVFLYFTLKIRSTLGEITGANAKREIEKIRNEKRELSNVNFLLTNENLCETTMILEKAIDEKFEILKSVIDIHTDEELI